MNTVPEYTPLELPLGYNIAWFYQQADQAARAARGRLRDDQVDDAVPALIARAFAAVETLEAYTCDEYRCPTIIAQEAFSRMATAAYNAMVWAIRELETWIYDPDYQVVYDDHNRAQANYFFDAEKAL